MKPLSPTELERFGSLVTERLGLKLSMEDEWIARVPASRAQELKLRTFANYLECLEGPDASDEFRILAERLTIGETYFFREVEQLQVLRDLIVPERLRENGNEKRLRLLSAGCSSGEEAFSLAMRVKDALPSDWKLEIVGIDANPQAIKKAKRASYSEWALRRMGPDDRKRYFRHTGSHYEIVAPLQEVVRFEVGNLLVDDQRWGAAFDAIFCRNVLIYFAPEAWSQAISRFHAMLRPDGYLFLGHSESLAGRNSDFRLREYAQAFYYQRQNSCSNGLKISPPPHAALSSFPLSASKAIVEAAVAGSAVDMDAIYTLMSLERYEQALEKLELARGAPESSLEAALCMAAIWTNAGSSSQAMHACDQVLQVDEFNAGAHYLLALLHDQLGDEAAAARQLEIASYLDLQFAMPHLQLGLRAMKKKQFPVAKRELELARTLLETESDRRLLLFGGGFNRQALNRLCQTELLKVGF